MPVVQIVVTRIGLQLFVGQGQIPFSLRMSGCVELEHGMCINDAGHTQSFTFFFFLDGMEQREGILSGRLADELQQILSVLLRIGQ